MCQSLILKEGEPILHRHMKKKIYKIIVVELFYGYSISGKCVENMFIM